MKQHVLILFLIMLVSFVSAQVQEEEPSESGTQKISGPYLGRSLNWLVGQWTGEGTQNGVAFSSNLDVSSILDATAVSLLRDSSGGYKEMILLGYDSTSKKNVATLYDNRYHTGLYTCTTSEKELKCSQLSSVPGYASQRIYQLAADGTLLFFIERQQPDQKFRKVLEIQFKKR